jgi:integrin beta 3
LSAGAGRLQGARSEIRKQVRERRQLRVAVLILASLFVLGALPAYFGVRAATRDPVFSSLDALAVPAWAASNTVDDVSGSRWCFIECRYRERTAESARVWEETAPVYEKALTDNGWRPWQVQLCPEQPVKGKGHYTCWKRDELTLDLWVRPPPCAADPAAAPSADPAKPPAPGPGAGECGGSLVSLKVRNAIDDDRTKPQPSTDPSLTGEDPDPTFSPLADLTPTPS